MCGIVGYVGPRETVGVLLDSLKRLEYRGYDSAGVALIREGKLEVHKKAGKVADLVKSMNGHASKGGGSGSATPAGPPTAPRTT